MHGPECHPLDRTEYPTLIICDIADVGLAFLEEAHDLSQTSKVIVVTAAEATEIVSACRQAGATGFVSKFSEPTELIRAVTSAISGKRFLCSRTKEIVSRAAATASAHSPLVALSPRELDIFRMIGIGMSTEAIADAIDVSKRTVDTHRNRIRSKLQLCKSRNLVVAAAQWVAHSGITTGAVVLRTRKLK